MNKIRVLMADDHQLFRKGLSIILNQTSSIIVVGEASDGQELLDQLDSGIACDVILLDVNMPRFNGIQTMMRLNRRGNQIPVLVLSMEEDELTIIQLIKLGIRGYILKDSDPDELINSIRLVVQKKFFLNGTLSDKLANALENKKKDFDGLLENIPERELEFLRYTPSDLTYKEIALEMGVGIRTVDYYRDSLFHRLQVKTRVGLALFAIKIGMVKV
ncbi:MAG TPA: response regulator transcription factor [Catalimonadaceae bacterium]|nr:response regulator transcription factor [Catalimonadaceae bacterium]HPI10059.1 response regulator transcription factor [Catalimonadaceae bacterium]